MNSKLSLQENCILPCSYVHSAPEEPEDRQNKILRVPGNQDKHVNIIFVKTPSTDSLQNTEIELPQQGQQKTLVYVLLRKGEASSDVKIRGPAPTQPAKPEVYFIRYKNEEQQIAAPQQNFQSSPIQTSPPRPQYGAPF